MEDIKSKKQPAKKVLDVSHPTKRAAAADVPSAPELVIPGRSVIPVIEPEIPAAEPITAKREARKIPLSTAVGTPNPAPEVSETPENPLTEESPVASEEPETQTETEDGKGKLPKTDANVQKALEEAKRQQELQGYIENREFFVPINAIARKRSVKVSMALTVIELLLGLLLLNLMLDAGIIQLLEKIPHTNFFDLN